MTPIDATADAISHGDHRWETTFMRGILVALIILPQFCLPQQQQIEFEPLELPEDVSHLTVYAVERDSRGFMWLASDDGVYRYDGYDFKLFQHQPADTSSLVGNLVHAILQDSHGYLWLGTIKGLSCYNPRTEKFTNFRHDPEDDRSLLGEEVYDLFEDNSGQLWVATWGGLNRLDRITGQFQRFYQANDSLPGLPDYRVMGISQDLWGVMWIATLNGLCAMTVEDSVWRFSHYRSIAGDQSSLYGNSAYWVHQSRDGNMWAGTHSGFSKINRPPPDDKNDGLDQISFSRILPSEYNGDNDEIFYKVAEDFRGNLWLSSWGNGLLYFQPSDGEFRRFGQQTAVGQAISDNTVQSIYADPDSVGGAIWVGSLHGIDRYFPKKRKFAHYQQNPDNANSLSNNHVHSILKDSYGDLWIGTMNGLNRRIKNQQDYHHYFSDPAVPQSLSADLVLSLFEDSRGVLWIGSYEGLHRFERERNVFKQDPPLISVDDRIVRVFAFCEDANGILWLGTRHGLLRYDRQQRSVDKYDQDDGDAHSLPNSNVQALLIDNHGYFWVGTTGGLAVLDRDSGKFHRFPAQPAGAHGLSSPVIRALHEDAAGDLWIATDGGLNRVLRDTKSDLSSWRFASWTEKDGLPANHVSAIVEDDSGRLWLPTSRGLSRFDPLGNHFRNYGVSDGLQSSDFTSAAAAKTIDGRIMIGGINGLNVFSPDSIRDNTHVPPVVLTDFRIFDQPVDLEVDINSLKQLTLDYDQNFFSFRFSALDYTQPSKNRYAYKLEGFDEDWVNSGVRRYASYTNLDPGDYVFRVRGSNNDGVWNEAGTSLRIIVYPPFWQTWWFRLLLLLAVAAMLLGIHRYRIHRINELQKIRTGIAADLHDEIASSLASIKLYSQFVQKEVPVEQSESLELLDRIRQLSGDVSEGIRQIVWSIDPRHDQLHELSQYLHDSAAALFRAAGIDYRHSLTVPPGVRILPEKRRAVYLILKEAMNNIVRHAAADKVDFGLLREGAVWTFELRDNGRGFAAGENAGNGLNNMNKRAASIAAELIIESQPQKGTTVKLKFTLT